jgi:hypothetical protein
MIDDLSIIKSHRFAMCRNQSPFGLLDGLRPVHLLCSLKGRLTPLKGSVANSLLGLLFVSP